MQRLVLQYPAINVEVDNTEVATSLLRWPARVPAGGRDNPPYDNYAHRIAPLNAAPTAQQRRFHQGSKALPCCARDGRTPNPSVQTKSRTSVRPSVVTRFTRLHQRRSEG